MENSSAEVGIQEGNDSEEELKACDEENKSVWGQEKSVSRKNL